LTHWQQKYLYQLAEENALFDFGHPSSHFYSLISFLGSFA